MAQSTNKNNFSAVREPPVFGKGAYDRGMSGRGVEAPARGKWIRNYSQGVRTRRTATRVISPGVAARPRQDRFFDRTPEAERRRRKREFEQKKIMYREMARRNKSFQKLRRAAIFLATFAITVSVLFGVVYKLFFVAQDITVVGNAVYSEDEIKSASGLDGTKTNLFSFSSKATGEKIKFYLPNIENASFHRTAPNKVQITVSEENPCFYTEIYGEYYGVSESLRILGRIDPSEASESGLVKLKLQAVKKAVSGGEIELVSDRAERYLKRTVSAIASSKLIERLDSVDLTDDFNVTMVADGKYLLDFGTQDDLSLKVRLAAEILEDSVFSTENKAYINLKDTSKTSVIIDNQLNLD